MSSDAPHAVIDVGSNSIKLLVGRPGNPIETVATDIRETRISAGMRGMPPFLEETSMLAALASIEQLVDVAAQQGSRPPLLVATSAVREASNGIHFCDLVREKTGLQIRILSGQQEAHYISMGALCDPALFGIRDFRLVDLGGGSLEVIYFSGGAVELATSLPLGAVRLTDRFLPHREGPVSPAILEAIAEHITELFRSEGIDMSNPHLHLVGSGGAFIIARNLISPRCPKILVADLQAQLRNLSKLSLEARRQIPGLPPERADIMVPALQTMITLGKLAHQQAFLNTKFNLRFGILREFFSRTEN